ncbi:MAG: iron-containing alcohol dehydrogenase [Prevotellaceae bacterium]|jgi:alcohol dehydrogenase|nr:iron-containing alcohol dehydrogenase [Prevotellaceae bacterium]
MYQFNLPTDTIFGAGTLNLLHRQTLPGKKAMIVISNGKSTRVNGYLDRTQQQLEKANVVYVVFDKVQPNPLKSSVEEGAAFARDNDCDFIVALGGGSVIDAAKAMAMLANEASHDLWDFIPSGTGKSLPRSGKALPVVAITTTAGTGSEVDAAAVITNPQTHEKTGFGYFDMVPMLAIVDAELMLTVPPSYTAYQGFDALFHSTEGYISNVANPVSEMFALAAIENVSQNLAACVHNGNDLAARERVALGNSLSGYQMMTASTSSKHSLEHAMSAYHQELPHGAGLIMLSLAYYTHFINAHACDDRFITMARVMGMKDADKPTDFLTVLAQLQKDCGVDNLKMSDYGIQPSEFMTLTKNAKSAMAELFRYDRIELSDADCVAIYEAAYK